MTASVDAFACFEQKWLNAYPENAVVAVFLPAAQRQSTQAFGCLVHELNDTVFRVREPQVATTKLAWWRQELVDAAVGRARHPVTQTLFADARVRAADVGLWPALADAASNLIGKPSASTLAILLERHEPYFRAITRVEAVLFCSTDANIDANAALWTISHLLHEFASLPQATEQLPLPLSLLARYGLTRDALAIAGTQRNALAHDYLDELAVEFDGALGVASGRSLTRRVRARLDRDLIAAAKRKTDPLAYLHTHARAGRWRSLWIAWREAHAASRAR